MANFKIDKTKDFTVMSNYHLRDKNLSLKAKGLLSFMLSLPENWDYSTDNIVNIYFGGSVHNPFDHYYRFVPKIGMPFFKEKEFSDFKIELVLQRKDILGNIFQRIVDLPILVNFYNNLIQGYRGPYDRTK